MVEESELIKNSDDALLLLMRAVMFELKVRRKQLPIVEAAIKKIALEKGISVEYDNTARDLS